jgi:hypothetical protein
MMNKVIFAPGDVYNKLKAKEKNSTRYITYFTILWNNLLEMFEWKNLPETIPKRFLESILHAEGEVFICKEKDTENVIASHGTLSGEIDCYGLGTECIATYPGNSTNGKRGIDIAYGINNDTASPDMLVYWIAHLLGEISKSEDLNVKYARLLPIPKVRDEKDKNAFDEIINKLMEGELKAFASKNILAQEMGWDSPEVFNISDVKDVDKLQYLSRYFDDVMKRFYNVYGQALQNQNKSAQSISDELHGMDSVSFILPLQMLNCRKALCKQMNDIFGLDVAVRFSPAWQLEYDAFINRDLNENGIPDSNETIEDIQNDETSANLPENDVVEENTEEISVDDIEGQEGAKMEEIDDEMNVVDDPSDIPAMDLEPDDASDAPEEDRKEGD